jgi:UDP-N-acetylglucosamine 4,6-dehydratase
VTTGWGFDCVRYGNVVGSRGSIVPVWRAAMARGEPIPVTDPLMTRFLITLDEALDLIDLAFDQPAAGRIHVRKSPSATVGQLARVVGQGHPIDMIRVRPGEKRVEHLVVPDEHAEDMGDHYVITPGLAGTGIRYSSDSAPTLDDEALAMLVEQAPHDM